MIRPDAAEPTRTAELHVSDSGQVLWFQSGVEQYDHVTRHEQLASHVQVSIWNRR